jgi:serine-type D-Ala-D-Ala carboxypeptidase/endopeptidase (penicillin-binding protein 4)
VASCNGKLNRLCVALACVAVVCTLLGTGSATADKRSGPYAIARNSDVPPPVAPASKALTALQKTLGSELNSQGGANSGLVIDETADRTLWAYNDTVGRLPASVEKLWTTTTALLTLGPDATFQTRVYGVGRLSRKGNFDGTLYLHGGGDPTFGSATFDHVMYGAGATVQTLAANLRQAGVKRIQGSIVGDESYFDSVRGGPDTGYQANLETEGSLSALSYDAGFTNLNEDALDADPPLVATQAFAAALPTKGVSVAPGTRIGTGVTPKHAMYLAEVSSPTLAKLMLLTNSPSDNFFAEMLLKDLGAELGRRGSTSAGAAVVRSFIGRTFELHPQLNDGSGLSRYDRTNVRQIVLLLREMQSQPAFWNSLSIAGVRGTLQDEMQHTRAANNCRGKTGTLHDVANLVGYCKAANGHEIVFAFMMNGLTSSSAGHELEDVDAEALANYRG